MPQTIARIYRTQQAANAAVKELRERSFNAEAIRARPQPAPSESTEPAATTAVAATDTTLESILKAGVPREHARIYAEGVSRGEVLVVVIDPPFGFASAANAILDSHGPIAVNLPEVGPSAGLATSTTASGTTTNASIWESATPLSSWLGWKVLSDDPTPLSTYMGRPALKTDPSPSPTLDNIRRQSTDAAPLSTKVGLSVLSDDPAPLSKRAGWSVLSDDPAPLSKKFGWRTLLDDPAPLSTMLGWKVLSRN
jgi:hypothetical protein